MKYALIGILLLTTQIQNLRASTLVTTTLLLAKGLNKQTIEVAKKDYASLLSLATYVARNQGDVSFVVHDSTPGIDDSSLSLVLKLDSKTLVIEKHIISLGKGDCESLRNVIRRQENTLKVSFCNSPLKDDSSENPYPFAELTVTSIKPQ